MTLDLLPCQEAPAGGGCGCGCKGSRAGLMAGVTSLPWWVYLAAFGLYAVLSGDEGVKAFAFGSKRSRARGRRS
jgi:hypothetical protein